MSGSPDPPPDELGAKPSDLGPMSHLTSFLSPKELSRLSQTEKKRNTRMERGGIDDCGETGPYRRNCHKPKYVTKPGEPDHTYICCQDKLIDLKVTMVHFPDDYNEVTTHSFVFPTTASLKDVLIAWRRLPGLDRHSQNLQNRVYLNYDVGRPLRQQIPGSVNVNESLITITDLDQELGNLRDSNGHQIILGNNDTLFVKMAAWTRYSYDPHRGWDCFGPNGRVELSDGTSKTVEQLVVGDCVQSQAGTSTISRVLKYPKTTSKLCNINGTVLTHKHPVFHQGEWIYPRDIANTFQEDIVLYNFEMKGDRVDKNKHTIVINDVTCATLGCGPENLQIRNPRRDLKSGSGYWDVSY